MICGGFTEDVGAQLIEFHGGHPPWFLRTPVLDIGDTLRLDPDSSSNSANGKALSLELRNFGLPDIHKPMLRVAVYFVNGISLWNSVGM